MPQGPYSGLYIAFHPSIHDLNALFSRGSQLFWGLSQLSLDNSLGSPLTGCQPIADMAFQNLNIAYIWVLKG